MTLGFTRLQFAMPKVEHNVLSKVLTLLLNLGVLSQFGYLSLIFWWASSVSNTVLTVWKPGRFSRKSHKRFFLVQLTLSLIIPGGLVTFALLHGLKYGRITPYTISCGPESAFWEFYLFALPADITVCCGTLMSIFVMVKLHQVRHCVF